MTFLDRIVSKLGSVEALDVPARFIRGVSDQIFRNKSFEDAMGGSQIGHPLHATLVVLPIGSFLSASVADASKKDGSSEVAQRLISVGLATALPTVLAGISDWRRTDGAERRVGVVHAVSNNLALWMYVGSLVARRRGNVGTGKLLALAGAGLLGAGGALGGHLAYVMGVGVRESAEVEAAPGGQQSNPGQANPNQAIDVTTH